MGKKRTDFTAEKYWAMLKAGYGQGTGADYKPWITVHDFPSNGFIARVFGHKTNRMHHLLSSHELDYFKILDFSPNVIDIREQYPLILAETLEIARELHVRHPMNRARDFPIVMTTDFLITTKTGLVSRAIKESYALSNTRVQEKLAIEKKYWDRKEIDWKIVTEKEIDRQKTHWIRWFQHGEELNDLIPDQEIRAISMALFCAMYYSVVRYSVARIIEVVEETFEFPIGTGIAIFKALVANGSIDFDMSNSEHDLAEIRYNGQQMLPM